MCLFGPVSCALKEIHSKTSGGKAVHMFNASFLAKSTPRGWSSIYFYVAQLLSATYFSKNLLSKRSKSEEGGWYENVIWPYHRKVVLKTVEVWRCISVSGGRSIPTEEFMSPFKWLMNSWPKSQFSWLKQLLVSSIQKSLWKEGIK